MQTTEISINLAAATSIPSETSERIKKICLDRLQLSADQTNYLFEQHGPRLLSCSQDPTQLQAIISDLERLGVLVQSSPCHSNPTRSQTDVDRAPRKPRRVTRKRTVIISTPTLPEAGAISQRTSGRRHVALALGSIALALAIGSASPLFWPRRATTDTLAKSDFNRAASDSAQGISQDAPVRTFLGSANFAPLKIAIRAAQRGDTISVRLSGLNTEDSPADQLRIDRIESEPTFLVASAPESFMGTAPAVFTLVRAGESLQISGMFEIALNTSAVGLPRSASIRLVSSADTNGEVSAESKALFEAFSKPTSADLLAG